MQTWPGFLIHITFNDAENNFPSVISVSILLITSCYRSLKKICDKFVVKTLIRNIDCNFSI